MPASIEPAPHHADPVRTEGMRRKEYLGSATIRLEKSKPAVARERTVRAIEDRRPFARPSLIILGAP
jgi:hypothetical protein